MEKDLKIYPVKVNTDKLDELNKEPLCNIPHLILILGKVKAGKTSLINSLYLSPRFYGDDFTVKIFISPSALNDPLNEHLVKEFDFVFTEYSDDLLRELLDMIEADQDDNNRYLIIFDDIIGLGLAGKKGGKVDEITKLSTIYRHMTNANGKESRLSICVISQYFKYLNPVLRNQASGIYICGMFADKELSKIAEAYNFFGGSDKKFIEIFKESRKQPHDFLFLNCHTIKAYRNHDTQLWCYDDMLKSYMPEDKMIEDDKK